MSTRARSRRQGTSDNDGRFEVADARETRKSSAAAASSKASGRDTSALRPRSLMEDPIPRRSARPRGAAKSVASIPTEPSRIDEESEVGEEESENQSTDEPGDLGGGDEGEDGDDGDDGDDVADVDDVADADEGHEGHDSEVTAVMQEMKVQYQVMQSLLPDIKRATHELKQRLEVEDHGHGVSAAILKARRSTLRALMDAYDKPGRRSPFVDFSWLESFVKLQGAQTQAQQAHAVTRASAQANLVFALDFIQQVLLGHPADVLSFLKALDAAFPRLFAATTESYVEHFDMALAIRTQLFIETLAAQTGQVNAATVIASVFCANGDSSTSTTNPTVSRPYLSGPFKGLAGIDEIGEGSREWTQILQRTEQLAAMTSEDATHHGLEKLAEEYALDILLEIVGQWCLEKYALSDEVEAAGNSSANEPVDTAGGDEFQDAQESIPDSQPESQVDIVRRPDGQEKRKSFIDGRDNGLSGFGSWNLIHGPQPGRPPPDAPSDYSVSSRALLQSESGTPVRFAVRKRRRASTDDGDEDADCDDEFQIDDRDNINPDQVRARLKASNPVAKGKRQALPSQQPASSSLTQPAIYSSDLSNAKFAYPFNLKNIRNRKDEVLHRVRTSSAATAITTTTTSSAAYNSTAPPPSSTVHIASHVRQRHPWSDKDSATLIELIAQERAGWSVIERRHNSKFEYPRNQQAYRDRARNMKVDFLLGDAVLPPCFDLVVLGKKEEAKVLAGGRNPHRKEHEFIRDGDSIQIVNALR
ncbi:hypothetical protein E4U43_007860 [Claviceps pusilla]|uniref:Myb-like domain-containing protein n=1 Tax=Claviceps pusilla TaxID=123648 RepID=A0A9P7T1A9_9HYPO|nr:hypothetical protein E4U43_007860 [Claviceps pusilla]